MTQRTLSVIAYFLILYCSLDAFGIVTRDGLSLGEYSLHGAHKAASRALLEGRLSYPSAITESVDYDIEIFNGSAYTTWGYGVPLLQTPFHAFSLLRGHLAGNADYLTYFPDRTIFAVYLAICTGLLFSAFVRFLVPVSQHSVGMLPLLNLTVRIALAAAVTYSFLSLALLWLIPIRFIVYEETIAYLNLAALSSIACFIHYCIGRKPKWRCASLVLAGVALLIRPTGMFFLAALCVAILTVDRKCIRETYIRLSPAAVGTFLSLLVPICLWMATNAARTGSFVSPGYHNATPSIESHIAIQRFNQNCNTSLGNMISVATTLLNVVFLGKDRIPEELKECHFVVEQFGVQVIPFIGPWWLTVIVLLTVVGLLQAIRQRSFDLLATACFIAALFGAYVWAGMSFAYRYAGDFYPLICLMLVQWGVVHRFCPFERLTRFFMEAKLPQEWRRSIGFGLFLSSTLIWSNLRFADRFVYSMQHTIMRTTDIRDKGTRDRMSASFAISSWEKRLPKRVRSYRVCGAKPIRSIPFDLAGWRSDCSVAHFTNLLLGVPTPASSNNEYQLILTLEGNPSTLPSTPIAMVNGRVYSLSLSLDETDSAERIRYQANVQIPFDKLSTKAILVTVLWGKEGEQSLFTLRRVALKSI